MSMRGDELAQELSYLSRAGEDEFCAEAERVMGSLSQHAPMLQDEIEWLDDVAKALGIEVRDGKLFARRPWKEMIWASVIAFVIGWVLTTAYHRFL